MKRCAVSFGILLSCFLSPLWCSAVQPYVPEIADPILEPWRWRYEEVLAGQGVLCMAEAEDGSLWFGNVGSIIHYDGITVTKIPFDEELLSKIIHSSSRAVPWAKALLTLKNNRLLALVGESLVLRADGEWRVVIQNTGKSTFDSRMIQGKDGTVWLLVPGVLWRISADLTEVSVVRKEPECGFPKSFCLDNGGTLWVVEQAQNGLFQLVQIPLVDGLPAGAERVFPIPFGQPSPDIQVAAGDDGLIWYVDALRSSGLESFDPAHGVWVSPDPSIDMERFFSVLKGRDGSIWCGGTGSLLHYSRESGGKVYDHNNVQLPRVALKLFETRDDRLWVIGRGGYVYSMDPRFREWVTYEGLGFECETDKGVQWFTSGVRKNVVSHDPGSNTWRQYGKEDGLIDRPHALFYSSHGLVWAVGAHQRRAAIAVFDGVRWERHLHPEFAGHINPKSVFEASDGTVWFGAGGSLRKDVPDAGGALQYQVQDDRSVRLLKHHSPQVLPYYVTSVVQTPDTQFWIGSTIIHRYDGGTPAVPEPMLQGENTVRMVLDQNQTLWAAKEHVGVCRKEENGWTVFGSAEGLPSLLINDLCLLRDGSLLVSSDQGLSRFDGKTWTAHSYPKWFGMIHPLSGVKESSDGSIWLNYSYNEMWLFNHVGDPERSKYTVRHRPETNPPETRIIKYLERVSQPGNTHVSWSGNDRWSRTPIEELQYSWRLDGGGWSVFSCETGSTFLDLESGRHVLEVRARDRAFNIDPTPARIEFTVIAPLWQQLWFLVMVSVFVGLILLLTWLLIRSRELYLIERQAEREKNLVEQQAEREAFLQNQQAERENHLLEIDRLKTGFFTNISHELRTPITVISGRLQTIFTSEIDEKTKSSLSIVLRNAQRVATLITQLLDFRKIQEGKIRVEPTHGDLIPPLREWLASLQVLAEQAHVSLSLECADEYRGWFDFDKLQKIFVNLIANSIKYTATGGEVRVCLNVEVDDCKNKTTGRRLILVVEDTGVGISEEHLPHIFDRFYRVSEASMAVGAGIGLNLTKELVDLLGGEIRAESPIREDNECPGTRFTVWLPIEQVTGDRCQVAGEKGQGAVAGDFGEPLRPLSHLCPSDDKTVDEESPLILIVEDDEDVRDFMVEGLESNYRLETAENGDVGLRMAKELVPDLIITDVMMPVMDGMALCRELKASVETSHIPVVMLTAKASLEHQMEGLQTGADDYVTKPFHMVLLRTRIVNLLESRRLLREQFLREYPVLTPTIPENTPDREFLEKITAVLEENYSEWEFNPDQFASEMNMSVRSLYRKLKAIVDRTPAGFISEFRMMRAAELLLNTSYTVTEIAFQTGYEESTNFARLFRAHYGVSPSQYRSGHRSS